MNVFFAKRRCYLRRVRDSDPYGRRHFSGSVALGGSAALVQYSPTRRDDFVRCDSAGARPKNFQTLNGYEQGLFGMEGRGLYAGGNVGGVYAQVAQNGGWSYGFQEQMYLAYGNNTSKDGADGKTGSVVSAELWLPTLGKYGHFAFGETHDVSNQGIQNVQREIILNLLKNKNPSLYDDIERSGFTYKNSNKLNTWLVKNGFERVDHTNGHGDGFIKRTYREKGSTSWGNIELMVMPGEKSYSSYNYGNHWWTHLMIDMVGFYGQNH